MVAVSSVSIMEWGITVWLGICIHLLVIVDGRHVINYSPLEISWSEMISYFRNLYQYKFSSMDETNEELYHSETFVEDLYHNIDNLMPQRIFQKLLLKTKNITDKTDGKGYYLLYNYPGTLNAKCSKDSIFNHTLHEILQRWEGEKSIIFNDIEQWQQLNALTPYNQICNRFRGLSCQFKWAVDPEIDNGKSFEISDKKTCQCAGDSSKIGFYKQVSATSSYPDGCYIRPWKQCTHLSRDSFFKDMYIKWHTNVENWRRQLAQIVFPVARTHRCKRGTYCVDIVPGMKQPICYCSPNSNDEMCKEAAKLEHKRVPLGNELAFIRRAFVKLILRANDTTTLCNSEYNADVLKISQFAGKNPTVSKVVDIMKQLAFLKTKVRICDFREGILCDGKTSTCQGNLNCGIGKIYLGRGVCAVNNGFPCQKNEDCIENAKCQLVLGVYERMCICVKGYGQLCQLEKAPFFTKLFVPIVSGFQGDLFIKIQTEMNKGVEAWEDAMTLNEGEGCNRAADSVSLDIIKYFGNLEVYAEEQGDYLIRKVSEVLEKGSKLCIYSKFLRCDEAALKCVPLVGSRILPTHSSSVNPNVDIVVELEPGYPCKPDVPLIFKDSVSLVCSKGYVCKKSKGLKVCAPDCNSVFAPLEACPVLSSSDMKEEPNDYDLETTTETIITSTLEELPETTLPDDEGWNSIDVTATEEVNVSAEENEQGGDRAEFALNSTSFVKDFDARGDTDKQMGASKENNVDFNTHDNSVESRSKDQFSNKKDKESSLSSSVPDANSSSTSKMNLSAATTITDPNSNLSQTNSSAATTVTDPNSNLSQTNSSAATTGPNPNSNLSQIILSAATATSDPNKTVSKTGTQHDTTQPTTQSPTTTAAPTTTPIDDLISYSTTTQYTFESTDISYSTTPEYTFASPDDVEEEDPIPVGPKATFGQLCAYNDTRVEYPDYHKHLICDGTKFLVCMQNQCSCLEDMVFSVYLNTCTIPISERCSPDIWRSSLPQFMDVMNLLCQFGVCKMDNVGKICRPESDRGLLLVKG